MADPTAYDRAYGFANFHASHPSEPLPGDQLDTELDAVQVAMSETQAALAEVRRSDGGLQNAVVGYEQLKPELSLGVSPAESWTPGAVYTTQSMVFHGVILYRCIVAHTAGSVFDASKFTQLADLSSLGLPDGIVTEGKYADNSVPTRAYQDESVSFAKLQAMAGARLLGRYAASNGIPQEIALDPATLAFVSGVLTVIAQAVADGSLTTAKYADASVTAVKLAAGAAIGNLGFTPLNKAGDTIAGNLIRNAMGAHLYYGSAAFASGKVTVSTADPSGTPADGDRWVKYTP